MRHNTSLAIAQPPPPNLVVLPDHDDPPPPSTPSPRTGGEGRGEGVHVHAAASTPGRVSLVGIGKKPTATGTKQKTYPSAPTSPELVQLVDYLVEHMPFIDPVENGKKELARLITPFYFGHATGRAEVESSVIAKGTKDELLVMFPKQLVGAFTEADLSPVLGKRTTEFFRSKWSLDIDGDKIPGPLGQTIIDELTAVFDRHGLGGEGGPLTASEKFVPLELFHLQRHLLLSADQNLALNGIARIKTSIKVRK